MKTLENNEMNEMNEMEVLDVTEIKSVSGGGRVPSHPGSDSDPTPYTPKK